jgi:hypothetical protein
MSAAAIDPDMNDPCAASELSLAELAAEICCMAGHINAASYRWLALIAELDRRRGWAEDSAQSCAHWLGWKCGVALGAAREKVRVARALERLPKTSAAMAAGRLSYSKAREITRVASAETEDFLLQIAEHGTAQHVEKVVRAYRRCQQAEELSREARQQANRFFSYRYDDDGSLVFHGQLPAEVGALLVQAIEAAVEPLPPADVPAGTSEPPTELRARRADALGRIAESFLAHGASELGGGDRYQVVVHVAEETLREGRDGRCEMEHGPSLAAETARRFGCDASVVAIVEGASGEPLDVGRKTRTISAPLRRLLRARDQGCRFPGCANDRYVDAHHIRHWAEGGETKPSNLVSLCRFHHRAVHEGGVRICVLDDGALRFVTPDGVDLGAADCMQPQGSWRDLCSSHERERIVIDADTAVPRWSGEELDYGLAVELLLQIRPASGGVPAGT